MERFLAIDSGKFATKVAEYSLNNGQVHTYMQRTKVSNGYLCDDAIERNTVVIEINGKVYKVGNGANGNGARLDTSKNDDVHKICTLTAIAQVASSNEVDEFNVAVGMPSSEYAVPPKRVEYKNAILPEGEIKIKIKPSGATEPITKKFIIKNRFVYPESIGALIANDEIFADVVKNKHIPTGVIDIGNLNLNATFWQGTDFIADKSQTTELGGAIIIRELANQLSASITRVDEYVAANILKTKSTKRQLPSGLGLSDEQVKKSGEIISNVLHQYAESIRNACSSKQWSLDAMRIIAIGGTSEDIYDELKNVFGNVTILPNANFCNALGYLRLMCEKLPQIDDIINLTTGDKRSNV